MPTWTKPAAIALLVITVSGVFCGIFLGGFPAMWKTGAAAGWPWWYYAFAVPVVGAIYIIGAGVGEVIGLVLFAPFKWGNAENPWKVLVFYLYCGATILALLAFPIWLVVISRG